MEPALFYETQADKSVRCGLCRHYCSIAPGGRGICRVRENRDGTLVSLVGSQMVAQQIDPIEKKPLYHLLPGSLSFSVAGVGCNFSCRHCQNVSIAKYDDQGSGRMPGNTLIPQAAVTQALRHGCSSIAYTYTEPTVWYEYALQTARLADEAGLYNIFVTNGYIAPEPLRQIAQYLHAANIDLKGFTEQFYWTICGARLDETLNSIREYRRLGIWIELTTLIIPGHNDDREQLDGIARFIADELGPDTPWHISRFFPHHRMTDLPPTPLESMQRAVEAGDRAGLRYIYEGNRTGGREATCCPHCRAVAVARNGYRIERIALQDGHCLTCGASLAGIWRRRA